MSKKRKVRSSPAEIEGTACHEAGHAVVCLALGMPFTELRVSPFRRNRPGGVLGPTPFFTECENGRERRENARKSIIATYAGLPAERLVDPDAPERYGSSDDALALKNSIDYEVYPRYWERHGDAYHLAYLERLRREAKRLVRLNGKAIRDLGKVISGRLESMSEDLTMSQEEVEKEIKISRNTLRK